MGNQKRKPINLARINALDDKEVLDIGMICDLTGRCPNTIRAMLKSGKLQGGKIQNTWFCRGAALKSAYNMDCAIDI